MQSPGKTAIFLSVRDKATRLPGKTMALVEGNRAVAAGEIKAGTPITRDNIVFKRSDVGLYPEELEHLFGRSAAIDLHENDAITWDVAE